MEEFSTCTKWACRHRAEGKIAKCPECGGRMETSRRVRILGWVLLACGIFLVGFMGFIAWNLYPTMTAPGREIDGSTFTGNAEQASDFFTIFAIVILFGGVATANGVWKIATGRRNRIFFLITMAFVVALAVNVWPIIGPTLTRVTPA
ncbi:MAG: hypothetical protein HKN78_09195 [Sphingomonadaceae bacterium]|nr:hypothetical protein [Sphingomonadaceae bacterium]